MLEINFEIEQSLNGFVENMPEQDYRNAEGISQSAIKTLITEPFKYFNRIETPKSDAMVEGTLLHLLFSAPHLVQEQFFITDSKRVDTSIKQEAGDRAIIKESLYQNLVDCVDYVKSFFLKHHKIDLDLMDSEVSYFGEYNGVRAKARADKITQDRRGVFDFKKTTSAKPKNFIKQACDLHYGIQEVFYRELMGVEKFEWIAIETTPLKSIDGKVFYMVERFETTPELQEDSKRLIDLAFEILENPQEWSKPMYLSEFVVNDVKNGREMIKKILPPMWYRMHCGI